MAYTMKRLSEVSEVENVNSDATVLIEQNGEVARAHKGKIGAQADWNETDETSPAFIMNKPVGGSVDNFYYVSNSTYRGFVHGKDATGEQVSGQALKDSFDSGNVVLLSGYGMAYGGGSNGSSMMVGYTLSDSSTIWIVIPNGSTNDYMSLSL